MKCEENCTVCFFPLPMYFRNFMKKIFQFISVLPEYYGLCGVSCDGARKTLSPVRNNGSAEEQTDVASTSLSHPTTQRYRLKNSICLKSAYIALPLCAWFVFWTMLENTRRYACILENVKYVIFLGEVFFKKMLYLSYVLPLTSDLRYTNLTTNVIYTYMCVCIFIAVYCCLIRSSWFDGTKILSSWNNMCSL